MTTKRESKRILSVKLERIDDPDGDWSYLGEFSDDPKDYAIVHVGEHSGAFEDQLPCLCGKLESEHTPCDDGLGDTPRGDWAFECGIENHCCEYDKDYPSHSNTLRFFNPNAANYKGEPDVEIRKYCLQDYERARTLGETWNFVGVRAEAEVQLTGNLCQTITSGGLWGIESDSDRDHFRMVESEEIDQLKEELHAIGFSKRAITAAFRDIQRND